MSNERRYLNLLLAYGDHKWRCRTAKDLWAGVKNIRECNCSWAEIRATLQKATASAPSTPSEKFPMKTYRKDLPTNPDRAIFHADKGEFLKVFDWIGPGFQALQDEALLEDTVDRHSRMEGKPIDGLLMFEGEVTCYSHGFSPEFTTSMEGKWRYLTAAEQEKVKNKESIWDRKEWFEQLDSDETVIVYFIGGYPKRAEKIPITEYLPRSHGFAVGCRLGGVRDHHVDIWDNCKKRFEKEVFLTDEELQRGVKFVEEFLEKEDQ